jgi:hypothetical protein
VKAGLGKRPRAINWKYLFRRASLAMAQLALLMSIVIVGATAWRLTENRAVAPDLHTCHYSNEVYESDLHLMRQYAPTHFRLMTSRYVQMVQAARGYNCLGTVTVGFDGHKYMQSGLNDDPGLAWLIPTISRLLRVSLADAFDLTTFVVVSLGVLIGYAGFLHLCPDLRARWMGAAAFLCLGLVEARVADVYIFQTSPLIAWIPWVLYFGLSRNLLPLSLSAALFAFSCSWFSLLRIGTTLVCMAFLIALLAFRYRVRKLFVPVLLIALACVPSMIFKHYMIIRRNIILASIGETPTAVDYHTIWHSIYIGFGFIPNSEVPAYNDTVASNKVRSIDPTVPFASAKYERILRHEVFNLAEQRPMLLIENLVAKTGIVIVLISILLFPSRRLLFAEREALWIDAAFVVAVGASAMNAILVVPKPAYLLTVLCLTFLYSSVKLCGRRSIGTEKVSAFLADIKARPLTPSIEPEPKPVAPSTSRSNLIGSS